MGIKANHVWVGAGIGIVGALRRRRTQGTPVEFRQVAIGAAAGALGSVLSDLLKSALQPYNRHALVTAAGVVRVIRAVLAPRSCDSDLSVALTSVFDGYMGGSAISFTKSATKLLPGTGGL